MASRAALLRRRRCDCVRAPCRVALRRARASTLPPARPPRAAFIQMASDIKARMAVVPAGDDAGDKGKIAVGRGETVGKTGGGGCC